MVELSGADAIFRIAFSIESAEIRDEYLKQACGENQSLYDRIVSLLRAHDEEPQFLETPPANVSATIDFPPMAERLGTQIGPYKLHQEIGEGGMGVVYMAIQKEPVRRKVALKIIKPGMDTREVIARFAAEQQALAMMDHPNIARVFDAGTTESGRPYFIMELVNGVPITQYCDDNNSTTGQRLELFTLVCHAVQHAHQKGIIHRDIKPSNILVTLHDGVPVPKVIDFGIAKAINQEFTSRTIATGVGHMIGTPLYMSPEQAERSGLDIDTRSDIYSLGVLLYELLTGSTPFDREQFQDAGLDEVRRLIREQEPPRPSTRISTMGKLATTVSEQRRTNPVELSNSLRHELDWIVMRALDKDRTRRYQTANDFARDIQRYLNDEPVEACPPSTAYRLKKFVRRHRTGVLATAGMGLALILGAGVAIGQAYRASQAEQRAEEQLHVANQQRHAAEVARKQADAATTYLVDALRSPDPARDGRMVTVAEVLDQAKRRLETDLQNDPLLKAKLLMAVGQTYVALGLASEGVDLLKQSLDIRREALGGEHADTLEAVATLADGYLNAGQFTDATSLLNDALRTAQTSLGAQHSVTVDILAKLGEANFHCRNFDEAITQLREAYEVRSVLFGPDDLKTLVTMRDLVAACCGPGQFAEAIQLGKENLQRFRQSFGNDHPETLTAMNQLAVTQFSADRTNEAIALLEEALPLMRQRLGPEHGNTITSMYNLARAYAQARDYEKSIQVHEPTLELQRKVFGIENPIAIQSMVCLAAVYSNARRTDEAVRLQEEALELHRRVLGLEHPQTLGVMSQLGWLYGNQGKYADAVRLSKEALELLRREVGVENPRTLRSMAALANTYWKLGKLEQSIPLLDELLALQQKVLGEDHTETLQTMANLGASYLDSGRSSDALPLLEKACRADRKRPEFSWIAFRLAECYVALGKLVEARAIAREQLELDRNSLPQDSPALASTLESSGRVLLQVQEWAEAESLLRECLAIRDDVEPDEWRTFSSKSMLGTALLGQKKYVDAEPLLLAGVDGLTTREAQIPPIFSIRLTEALERLVQLYTEWEKPAQAASWSQALDEHRKRLEQRPGVPDDSNTNE